MHIHTLATNRPIRSQETKENKPNTLHQGKEIILYSKIQRIAGVGQDGPSLCAYTRYTGRLLRVVFVIQSTYIYWAPIEH